MQLKKILGFFIIWKIALVIVSLVSFHFIPLGSEGKFLGGGLKSYSQYPYIFGWANFDGEHYLSIAKSGYQKLQHAFFPTYPILVLITTKVIFLTSQPTLQQLTISGLIISNLFLLLSLVVLWKLVRLDYSEKIATLVLVILLAFPTSFYLGAVYTESLFLFLTLSAFYFLRQKRWLIASILGSIASATRIFGVLLLPAFLLEAYQQKESKKNYIFLLIVPVGFLLYMLYQWITVGDPLSFFKAQKLVGEQHGSNFVLLPQIYYRYLKILLTIDSTNPIYQTIVLEFISGVVFLILPIYGYIKKIKGSYILFAFLAYLISIMQGSFVSLPRYALVFFPSFIAAALLIKDMPKLIKIILIFFSTLYLFIETALFLRAYWVS